MQHLGKTRSAHHSDHLLQTPDTFVRAPLPGMRKATAIVHIGPAGGARFTQYTVEFDAGGTLEPSVQRSDLFTCSTEKSRQAHIRWWRASMRTSLLTARKP